jgi:hypothetical protein
MKIALHLALLFLSFTFPVSAHDIEYDTGAICDTRNQAARLAMLLDGNEHTAIAMVNAEEGNPNACAVETVAFVRGGILATARSLAEEVCGRRDPGRRRRPRRRVSQYRTKRLFHAGQDRRATAHSGVNHNWMKPATTASARRFLSD